MAFNPGEDLPGRPSKRSKASLNDSTPQIEYDLTDDNGNVIAYFDNTTLDPPRTATPSSESVCMANDSDISMSDIRGSPECTASSRSCNETTIASTSTSSYFLYDDLRRSANNTDIPAYGSSSKAYRHGDSSSTKDDGIARLNKNEDEQRDIIRSKIMMHSTYLPRDERLLHYVINLSPFASYDSRVRAEGWDSVAKLCNQAIAGLHENKKGVYNFGSGDAAERRFETIMDAHVQVNNGKQDLLDIDFYTAYEAMLPMIEKAYAMYLDAGYKLPSLENSAKRRRFSQEQEKKDDDLLTQNEELGAEVSLVEIKKEIDKLFVRAKKIEETTTRASSEIHKMTSDRLLANFRQIKEAISMPTRNLAQQYNGVSDMLKADDERFRLEALNQYIKLQRWSEQEWNRQVEWNKLHYKWNQLRIGTTKVIGDFINAQHRMEAERMEILREIGKN